MALTKRHVMSRHAAVEQHHRHAATQLQQPQELPKHRHMTSALSVTCAGTLAISGYTAVRVRRVLRPFLLREFKEANARADHPIGEEAAEILAAAVSSGLEVSAGTATYFTIVGLLGLAGYLANGTEADRIIAARSRCVCVWKMPEGPPGQQMTNECSSGKAHG
jgi:hypothetical protein